jgi:hypothetical protein
MVTDLVPYNTLHTGYNVHIDMYITHNEIMGFVMYGNKTWYSGIAVVVY